jgi:outer membrane lipoprotein SlyB
MRSKSLVLLSVLSVLPCVCHGQSPYEHRNRGLALGALLGGLTGGAIGHTNGETTEGALIGGAVGALAGAAIGDSVDTEIARNNAVYEQRLARQQSQAVTVQDVIAMSQAKLSDAVIATHIKTHGVAARPQPNDLILLSNAGVSDTVISALQTAPLAVAPAAPPTAYRNVIVREHYYAPPVYVAPVYPPWHLGPCRPHPRHVYHYGPGVHWGVSIGH